MAEKICDLIPIPVLVTQEKEYFIDYLLMKIQESTFDKVFDEMMINFEKKIDSLPEVYKRTLFAMEILFGKSETKEKMEKALELLVRTRSKIPENIVKEWNMTFYGGMPVVIVWAAAIIGVIAGIVTIVQSCHDVITTYGSSDVIESIDTSCREEEVYSEEEIEYVVEYACYQYYDEHGNLLDEYCDEPVPTGDIELIRWSDEIIWEDAVYVGD